MFHEFLLTRSKASSFLRFSLDRTSVLRTPVKKQYFDFYSQLLHLLGSSKGQFGQRAARKIFESAHRKVSLTEGSFKQLSLVPYSEPFLDQATFTVLSFQFQSFLEFVNKFRTWIILFPSKVSLNCGSKCG